jgi:hypothetical protein
MDEAWYKKTAWITKKIPKKEKGQVRYVNHEVPIAILTQDIYTFEFKMYKVNNEDKNLVLLGKSKIPSKLEEKYLTTVDKPNYGYALKEDK